MIISRQSQSKALAIGATATAIAAFILAATAVWMVGAERTLLFVIATFCGLLLAQAFLLIYALSIVLPAGRWELDECGVSHTGARGRTKEIGWSHMQSVHATRNSVRFNGHRVWITIPIVALSRQERWTLLRLVRRHYREARKRGECAYRLDWPCSLRSLRRARMEAVWHRLPFLATLLVIICVKPILAPVYWNVLFAFVAGGALWRVTRVRADGPSLESRGWNKS